MATVLLDLAGGKLLPAMFFTMVTSLILGMACQRRRTTSSHRPLRHRALVQMGIPVLSAHMFAFYFGIVADVTPPVALAAYAGAGISGANPLKTGVVAAKLAIAAFIVPYIFVLSPEILMINGTVLGITIATVTALIGMWGISISMIGYCIKTTNLPQRLMFFFGGLMLIDPGVYTDTVGFGILLAAYMWQKIGKDKAEVKTE